LTAACRVSFRVVLAFFDEDFKGHLTRITDGVFEGDTMGSFNRSVRVL
jgi:hypothetical protein